MKISLGIPGIVLASLMLSTQTLGTTTYIVKSGDKLSEVLDGLNLRPIYGRYGKLEETIRLNPVLLGTDGNFISPGQTIKLPIEEIPSVRETASSDNGNHTQLVVPITQPMNNLNPLYPHSGLSFGLGSNYFRIDASEKVFGSKLEILSSLNWDATIGYRVNWDNEISSLIKIDMSSFSIKDAISDKEIQNSRGKLYGLGLEMEYKILDNLGFDFAYYAKQELFLRGKSTSTFELQDVMISHYLGGLKYDFYSRGRFYLGAGANYTHLSSTHVGDFKIESGNLMTGYVYLTEKKFAQTESQLKFKLGYTAGRQNSNFAKQESRQLFLNLIFDWGL